MSNGSIDNWLDYLIKRWPIVAAMFFLIMGVAKTQWVQNAQASDINELKGAIVEIKTYNETFRKEYRDDQKDMQKTLAEISRAVKA